MIVDIIEFTFALSSNVDSCHELATENVSKCKKIYEKCIEAGGRRFEKILRFQNFFIEL